MDHLRQIALTVDEQEPGHFYWVLIESKDDARRYDEFKASPAAFGTYMEALEAGFAELRRMVNWRDGLRG
ncbi:hypothetical protein J2W35_003323 [Variovorax boronicumulans]|uniref:hypothetical protein n=1 Tax=Variovorax boronicumulans TaxID=436515 RepID=UPI002780D9A3|nr:hypothetical protein [Variovorax boronicumulans]MDQ0082964.1 hypothetical protein [Variovorax boronicumulans]